MTEKTVISFETDGPRADEHLIREYVLSAMERLPAAANCDNVGFLRYGHDPQTKAKYDST
jgi:putative aminopeptidase FrvX